MVKHTYGAFSLMELMVVVSIIAILAAIGIPTYRHSVVKTHRADGQLALLKLSSTLENYYLEKHTYNGATFDALGQRAFSPENYYRLAIILERDGQSYQLQAIPLGPQAAADKGCGTLQLSTDGRRTFLGDEPNNTCW